MTHCLTHVSHYLLLIVTFLDILIMFTHCLIPWLFCSICIFFHFFPVQMWLCDLFFCLQISSSVLSLIWCPMTFISGIAVLLLDICCKVVLFILDSPAVIWLSCSYMTHSPSYIWLEYSHLHCLYIYSDSTVQMWLMESSPQYTTSHLHIPVNMSTCRTRLQVNLTHSLDVPATMLFYTKRSLCSRLFKPM